MDHALHWNIYLFIVDITQCQTCYTVNKSFDVSPLVSVPHVFLAYSQLLSGVPKCCVVFDPVGPRWITMIDSLPNSLFVRYDGCSLRGTTKEGTGKTLERALPLAVPRQAAWDVICWKMQCEIP